MRQSLFAILLIGLTASLACQAQRQQVFAYRLPDAALRPAAADPPAATGAPQTSRRSLAPLDLNRASAAQLAAVPGLTPALAARIVAARPWRAKRDLLRRRLLSASQYARAKRFLVVHRPRRLRPSKR